MQKTMRIVNGEDRLSVIVVGDPTAIIPSGTIGSNFKDDFGPNEILRPDVQTYNDRVDGMESLILALACNGFDIEDPKFADAVWTSLNACTN